jgi:hypothetical protein
VYECGGPTHNERRRAIKSHEWRLSGAAGACVVYARYPSTKYMSSVDAACVYECGGPTHNERRRAIKSHEWRLSGAAGACVGVRTLWKDQVHVVCRCSMRVRVRRAHARRHPLKHDNSAAAPGEESYELGGARVQRARSPHGHVQLLQQHTHPRPVAAQRVSHLHPTKEGGEWSCQLDRQLVKCPRGGMHLELGVI